MKKFMKKLLKKTEGFTLVELIVVIAILGILAGVGVAGYGGYITKANKAADEAALTNVKTALNSACALEGIVVPTTFTVEEGEEFAIVTGANNTSTITGITGVSTVTAKVVENFTNFYGDATMPTLESGSSATWDGAKWTFAD